DELVVVEVKTRSGDAFGHPAEAVTHAKLLRLRRLAAQWLAAHDVRPRGVRIDVVAGRTARRGAASVEHLTGVAGWRWGAPARSRSWVCPGTSSRWRRTWRPRCPGSPWWAFPTRRCPSRATACAPE